MFTLSERLSIVRRLSVALLCLLSASAVAGSREIGLQMVRQAGLGQNFTLLATKAAGSTQTYRMMESKVGPARTTEIIADHLRRACRGVSSIRG